MAPTPASLEARAGLLTGVIAAVAVLIAGVVALPLVRGAAEAQAQVSLAGQADLVADVASNPHDFDNDGHSGQEPSGQDQDRKSTRLNSSHT